MAAGANWRRGTDFYPEGQLLWLDVDTKIRELSHGRQSLDDFAHAFYGMDNGSYVTRTYTFQDVVDTLNKVQPYDWATFLRERLDYTGAELPEHGMERGGWKLVYTDKPSAFDKATSARPWPEPGLLGRLQRRRQRPRLRRAVGRPGVQGRPGAGHDHRGGRRQGLHRRLTEAGGDRGRQAARRRSSCWSRTSTSTAPSSIDYHGGLKYPHLVRVKGTPDRLDRDPQGAQVILRPCARADRAGAPLHSTGGFPVKITSHCRGHAGCHASVLSGPPAHASAGPQPVPQPVHHPRAARHRLPGHHPAARGRHRPGAPHLQRARDDSGQRRPGHAAVPDVDPG